MVGQGAEPGEVERPSDASALDRVARDLTRLARDGTLDPVIGRARETETTIEVLVRRKKSNPVLIGEPGVGKAEIVEGPAQRIVAGEVPATTRGKRLVEPNVDALVAGSMYRGEFEERVQTVLDEIRAASEHMILSSAPGFAGTPQTACSRARGGAEMDDIERGAVEDTELRAPAPLGRERRMTAGRKREAVLRLVRGEPLELVARELSVTAAELGAWRDAPLGSRRGEPEVPPKGRPGRDDRPAAHQGGRADDGGRAAPREGGAAGRWRPFGGADACAMSAVVSISARRRYGLARVCRVWGVARSGVYRSRRAVVVPPAPRRRPGPQGPMPDAALVAAIRRVLAASPFHGEGTRKVWARLRHTGLHTSEERVRRLMRENGLLAATRVGRPHGPRNHDGTIIPEAIDAMRGTDVTAAFTVKHGQVAAFVAVDHCSAECTGIHAARRGTRHEALEPIRQGVVERFGAVAEGAAQGLSIRHDHGSQHMSHDFQHEVARAAARHRPRPSSAPPRPTAAPRGSSGP